MKTCSKCGESKEKLEFPKGKSQCKSCEAARRHQHYLAHREEHLARSHQYQLAHHKQGAAASRKYRLAHREKYLASRRQYNLAHREKMAACRRRYFSTHHEEICARIQQYRKEHPEVVRAYVSRRIARMHSAAGCDYTTADMIVARWEMFGDRCWICGDKAAEATDHVKPLAKGGAHWPCNLRPICKSCNSSKGDKWPYQPINRNSSNIERK